MLPSVDAAVSREFRWRVVQFVEFGVESEFYWFTWRFEHMARVLDRFLAASVLDWFMESYLVADLASVLDEHLAAYLE